MLLTLDTDSKVNLYQQVFTQLRDAIHNGLLTEGMKLPAIRELAADLECSRNTIETAYRLLLQEGYVTSRPGYGYIVQKVALLHADPIKGEDDQAEPLDATPLITYDFTYGNLQPGTFPATSWRTITDAILRDMTAIKADCYTDTLGEPELRHEIARRLSGARSIACTPDQIIIQGGTEASVANLLTLFDHDKDSIMMEEPGYSGIRDVFLRHGFTVIPVPVEEGTTTYLEALHASKAKLAYVTPSSQFPTCQVMPAEVRKELLEWAQETDAYILEDDYCREFRYRERPIPPLKSLADSERVIYMGTFSKSFSPALRMNYLVLSGKLLERWRATFAHSYPAVPWLNQAVLARFMHSGQWDRHIRRLHAQNMRKFETLVGAIGRHMGQRVAMRQNGTGLHILVDVLDGRTQEELISAAASGGVQVYPTSNYCMVEEPSMKSCILIGFSAIPEDDIDPGIKALAEAWFG